MEYKFNDHAKDTMIDIVERLESVLSIYKAHWVERKCCLDDTEGYLLSVVLGAYTYNMRERIEHSDRSKTDFTHVLKWDFIRELDFKPLPLEKQHTFNQGDIK